jgi:hypothetical protein
MDTLSISDSARLDLTSNKLVIGTTPIGTAGGGGIYDGISGMIQSGRNGGNWTGSGIVTSQSAATVSHLTSIGVASAAQAKGIAATATAVWGGQTVTGSDALVMYTYAGDATLDGKIDVDDYARVDSNIGLGTAGWYNGDFNYDGKVNVDDYGIIDTNIAIQGAPFATEAGLTSVAAVPEPAAAALVLIVAGLTAPRRLRRPEKST